MTEQLTNRTQIKTYLQIADTSKDSAIDTFMPVAESAVRELCNNSWDIRCKATWTSGRPTLTIDRVTVYTGSQSIYGDLDYFGASGLDLRDYFFPGNIVRGTGIPNRAEIIAVDDDAKTITLDVNTTADGDEADVWLNIFPLMGKTTLSKIVSYFYTENEADYVPDNDSETVGTASFTRGDGEEIGAAGLPEKFRKALLKITRPRFV